MAKNEKTSKAVALLASKALRSPGTLTNAEIKKLAASALTQSPDKPAAKKRAAKKTAKKAAKKPARKSAAKKVTKKAAAKKATKRR